MFYEAEDVPDLDPAEAMGLVAHEIRVDILLALWRAADHELPFSELYRRVDVDDTAKFNYHLAKLEGHFLANVGDHYELIYPGHRVVDAIQSGALTRRDAVDPFPVEGHCPDCGGGLAFEYEGYVVRIHCRDCGERLLRNPFDPAGFVDRDADAVVRAFDRALRRLWGSAADGVCPTCSGPSQCRLVTPETLPEHNRYVLTDQPRVVATECANCSFYAYFPVGIVLLDHPGVVCFCVDRGIDVDGRPFWTLPFVADADRVTVVEDDPVTVTVTVDGGDASARATVDASASVADLTSDH